MSDERIGRRGLLAGAAVAAGGVIAGTRTAARGQAATKPAADYRLRLSLAGYSYREYLGGGPDKATMTIEEFIDLGAALGLDAVEPTSYYIYRCGAGYMHELKARAFRKGLVISGTAIGNNFCLPPGEALDKELANLRQWVDNAVEMGAPHIRVFAGKARGKDTREEDFRLMIAAMRQAVEYAEKRGVFLGIENHGYLTEGPDDVLRIVEAVPSPWFGINLDTGNFKDNGYEAIARVAPKAVNCQVKTTIRDGGQAGEADLTRIFTILRRADYRGYVALEYEGKEPAKTAVPRYIERMKPLAACAASPARPGPG